MIGKGRWRRLQDAGLPVYQHDWVREKPDGKKTSRAGMNRAAAAGQQVRFLLRSDKRKPIPSKPQTLLNWIGDPFLVLLRPSFRRSCEVSRGIRRQNLSAQKLADAQAFWSPANFARSQPLFLAHQVGNVVQNLRVFLNMFLPRFLIFFLRIV